MSALEKSGKLILLLAGLQAFGPLSIDMYLPGLPQIAEDLSAQHSQVQLSVSSFLIGLFIGMLFYGPLSDRFGRRKLLLSGIFLYLLASLGCYFSATATQLTCWRFIQALGGAAASVLGRTIVRDIYPVNEAARTLSLMHLVTMIATLMAPLIGGYIIVVANWRWLFALLWIYSLILLLLTFLRIPETHPVANRNPSILAVFTAYWDILQDRVSVGYILCMSLCFAGMFAFITASSFVYIDYFGLSPQQYAYLFSLNIVGIMVMVTLNARLLGKWGAQGLLYAGASLGAISGVLLLFAGTLTPENLLLIFLGVLGHVSVTGLLGANCIASLLARQPDRAGAATGLAISTQFGLGALASSLVSALYDGTPFYMTLLVGTAGIGSLCALVLTRRSHSPVENPVENRF